MKRSLSVISIAALLMMAACTSETKVQPTRNVIFLIADGMSTGSLTLSRWYKQYTQQTDENLNLDPYICGLVRASHCNAPIAGSAGSMTSYMTGELVSKENICVYPRPGKYDMVPVDTARACHPLANLADAAKGEKGKSVGVVVTTYFCHATPAATAAHAYNRSEYGRIASQMAGTVDVCIGGGTRYCTPKVESILSARGVPLLKGDDYEAFRAASGDKLWALFAEEGLGYDIDRPEGVPSLADMTSKAIEMLSHNKNGFFLMVEGSAVDFAAHANDPAGIVSEVLAFDEAVKVALDFARKDGNTTVVVTADHATSGVMLGDRNYSHYSSRPISVALGSLPEFKASSGFIATRMNGVRPESMKDTIRKYTGIEMTPEEEADLIRVSGKTEDDYMEVANTRNIQSTIAKLMSSRTHVGYVSGNHSGEEVVLACYNPRKQRPEGFTRNIELNGYMCGVLGLGTSLRDLSDKYFTAHDERLSGYGWSVGEDAEGEPVLCVTARSGKVLRLTADSAVASLGDESLILKQPAVYSPDTEKFYISEEVLDILK